MGGRGSKKFSGALVRAPHQQKQGVTFPGDKRRPQSLTTDAAVMAMHDKMMQHFGGEWTKNLAPDEISALSSYQGMGYDSMNNSLREMGADGATDYPHYGADYTAAKIEHATNALDKASLPQDMITWRKAGLYKTFAEGQALVGQKETDYGFTSTTISKQFALNGPLSYGPSDTNGPLPVIYRFHLPKGANAAYIEAATKSGPGGWAGEREILIQRNSEYRITKATIATGNQYGHTTYALILDATYLGSPKDARLKVK